MGIARLADRLVGRQGCVQLCGMLMRYERSFGFIDSRDFTDMCAARLIRGRDRYDCAAERCYRRLLD